MPEMTSRERGWWGADLLDRAHDDALWALAGHPVTYGRLRREVAGLRRLLGAHGIRAGATVALQGMQSFTQLWSLFALWSLDAQVMLIGPGISGRQLARVLDQQRPQFHLGFRDQGPRRPFSDECEVLVRRLQSGRAATTGHCLVHFTSGSTGEVKAVGRTPESLLSELDVFRRIDGMPEQGSRVLLLGPVAHAFPLVGGMLHNTAVRAVSVFPRSGSRPGLLRSVLLCEADTVLGAPGHFRTLVTGDRSVRPRRLRRAISGGDRLEPAVHARFAERFGVRIGQAYGTTESGIVAADPEGWFGPDAVGPAAPGVRVRLTGDGELRVRLNADPYTGPELPPNRFLHDADPGGPGWLCTRDRARLDPHSDSLRILGRCDPPVEHRPSAPRSDDRLLLGRTTSRLHTDWAGPR